MSGNIWVEVRTVALRDVLKGPAEYELRRICRWYSKTFQTPLHEVDALPQEYVLQHYFEAMWENMDPLDREEERRKILLTDVEVLREDMLEGQDAVGTERLAQEAQEILNQLNAKKAGDTQSLSPLAPGQEPAAPRRKMGDPGWEPDLGTGAGKPAPEPAFPAISMNFGDTSEASFVAVDEESALDRASGSNLPTEPPRKLR